MRKRPSRKNPAAGSGSGSAWSLDADVSGHPGEWVAVRGGTVVDHDKDFSKLLERVEKRSRGAVLVQVPDTEILVV